ncbi:hypothetical protein Hdeb2414_s0006g00201751 [Helianthus debilis subsp. tardiflorus]
MLSEEDQEQDKPNSGELNPSSDEISSNNFTVETTDDVHNTEHDHNIGDSVTRSDSVAVVEKEVKLEDDVMEGDVAVVREVRDEVKTLENQKLFLLEPNSAGEDESGTEEEQAEFMKELESFHREVFVV